MGWWNWLCRKKKQEVAQEVQPEPVVEQKVAQKPKKKAAPKKKQPTVDFEAMTKLELDIYARDNLGLKIDRRKTKAYMIEQIENKLKEK